MPSMAEKSWEPANSMPAETDWKIIDSQDQFDSCCELWKDASMLAIDTEFMRTNTFYPKLGLLQVADSASVYLIDPLCIERWDSFTSILKSSSCEVVMHSAGEDLTVFQATFGQLPQTLFDTQIAAAYLGKGFSLSYQALVMDVAGVEIPKDETRSDWLKRPLSESQLRYAALDVQYLLQIRDELRQQLESCNMFDWFTEDSAQLLRIAESQESSESWEHYYDKVSNAWKLNNKELKYLQELCYWREQQARRRNKPRNWIAKDNELLEIAQVFARDESLDYENWNKVSSVNSGFKKHNGSRLIERFREQAVSAQLDRNRIPPPLSPKLRNQIKQLREIVTNKAEELDIAPELLARKRWLTDLVQNALVGGSYQWPSSLAGWRQEILSPQFLPVLEKLKVDA